MRGGIGRQRDTKVSRIPHTANNIAKLAHAGQLGPSAIRDILANAQQAADRERVAAGRPLATLNAEQLTTLAYAAQLIQSALRAAKRDAHERVENDTAKSKERKNMVTRTRQTRESVNEKLAARVAARRRERERDAEPVADGGDMALGLDTALCAARDVANPTPISHGDNLLVGIDDKLGLLVIAVRLDVSVETQITNWGETFADTSGPKQSGRGVRRWLSISPNLALMLGVAQYDHALEDARVMRALPNAIGAIRELLTRR